MGRKSTKANKMEKCDCPDCIDEVNIPICQDEMVEDFLIRTRRIMLVGEINEIVSTHICNQLQMLSLIKEPIYLYINSPGGDLSSGYGIIDQMMISPCPIYTIIRGQAHSMGAIIAAFGERGHRYSTPNSSIMLHSIIIQNPPNPIETHTIMTDYIQKDYLRKIVNFAKRLKITAKQLKELMNKTQWLSPEQAIKIGLIDGIWNTRLEQALNKGLRK